MAPSPNLHPWPGRYVQSGHCTRGFSIGKGAETSPNKLPWRHNAWRRHTKQSIPPPKVAEPGHLQVVNLPKTKVPSYAEQPPKSNPNTTAIAPSVLPPLLIALRLLLTAGY